MRGISDVIQVRMIGPLEVFRADGTKVCPEEWKTRKTRDLFRLLVLHEGRPVRPERITAALWPEVDPARAAASLRTAASRIRTVLRSQCVVRDAHGMSITGVRSDVAELDRLVVRVRTLSSEGAYEVVRQAVAPHERLLAGELLPDAIEIARSGDDPWAEVARDRVARLQRELLTLVAESAIVGGAAQDAADLARRAIATDPFWERPHRVLMRALARLGEADEALRIYDRLSAKLGTELGVSPSPKTRTLRDQIQRQQTAAPRPSGRPSRSVRAVPQQLGACDSVSLPAEPGWGSELEQYVTRWLRGNGRGSVRVQVALAGESSHTLTLDLSSVEQALTRSTWPR